MTLGSFLCCVRQNGGDNGPIALTLAILGLDNAGKTTLLAALQGKANENPAPTVGFNRPVNLADAQHSVTLYDLGGGRNIRAIWPEYLPEVHGVIYVVDAADPGRFAEAREVLHQTAAQPALDGKPLLVLANKQDQPAACGHEALALALDLCNLPLTSHNIVGCTALVVPGKDVDARIRQGYYWLVDAIDRLYGTLGARVAADAAHAKAEAARKKAERVARGAQVRADRERAQALEKLPPDPEVSKPHANASPKLLEHDPVEICRSTGEIGPASAEGDTSAEAKLDQNPTTSSLQEAPPDDPMAKPGCLPLYSSRRNRVAPA